MTIFDLRSRDDVRRFIHSVAPSIAVLLISTGAVHQDLALLGMAVVLAVFNDSLAHINSPDSFRKWFYPVLSALTLMLVTLGVVTNEQLAPWLAVIPVIIGGGMGARSAMPQPPGSPPEPTQDDTEPLPKVNAS